MATILISTLLLVGVVLAVRSMVKNRGRCASCDGCTCGEARRSCAKRQ
jgi:hypothetical protein